MPFSDPSSGFYSPAMPNTGPVDSGGGPRMTSLPGVADINSPRSQPFQNIPSVTYQPDQTAGVSLKGAAEVLGNSVNAVDQAIKIGVDDDARKGVTNILNKQIQGGLDAKQDIIQDQDDEDNSRNQPISLTQGVDKLTTLDKAKRAGAISDTQFYAQANDLVSGLKNKYPGYSSVVDDKIKSILGIDPAEGIRKSLQSDLDQLKKDQTAKQTRMDSFIQQNQKYFPPDWQTKSYTDLRAIAAQGAATDHAIELDNSLMANKKAHGEDIANDAAASASWQTSMNAATMVKGMNGSIQSQTGKSMEDWLQQGFNGDSKNKDAVIGTLRKVATTYDQSSVRIFNQSLTPETDPSNTPYNALLRAGKQDVMRKVIDDNNPFTKIADAIGRDDMVLAGAEVRKLAMINSAEDAKQLQNSPILTDLGSKQRILGPTLGPQILSRPEVAGYVGSVIAESYRQLNAAGGKPVSDLYKTYIEANKGQDQSKQAGAGNWQTLINDRATALTVNDMDPKTQQQHYRDVFLDHDPSFLIRSVGNQGMDTFLKFTTPDIQKKVSQMPQDIQDGYANWTKTNFANLYSRLGDEIKTQVTSSPYYTIQPDDASGHYVTVPTDLARSNPARYQVAVQAVNPSLTKLNAGIDVIKPVVENSGQKLPDYLQILAKGLQIDDGNAQKGGFFFNNETNTVSSQANQKNFRRLSVPELQDNGNNAPTGSSVPSKPLLDLIRKGEASGSYDAMFGVKGDGAKISNLTVDEVLSKQKEAVKGGSESSAAGGYQFINKTLQGLKDKLGLKGDEKMTPELQDKLGHALVEQRGYSDYKSGKISKYQFADNLSKEWAALPNMTGKGTYDGVGSNKANVSLTDLLSTIDQL